MQISLSEAQAHLPEIVHRAMTGEEIVVTEENRPVVKILAVSSEQKIPFLGCMQGAVTLPEDWDVWPEEEARALGIID